MITIGPARSIAAADKRFRPERIGHVLLATDLGDASASATDEAIELAARHHAVLQILAVARRHEDRARMERGVRAVSQRARALGVVAGPIVWHGDPAEAILQAVWTEHPDVVVLGSRRSRDLGRVLRGSVSTRVAKESPCRVMVVPLI